MKISCIYLILNKLDDKLYIGSAVDFERRKAKHIRLLNSNCHPNSHLQSAWNKYGANNFGFSAFELIDDKANLIDREQFWIDYTKCYERDKGYNICRQAETRYGVKHTDATKEKMSIARKGRRKSKEWQDKITAALQGKTRSEEIKKKMSEARIGKTLSAKTRAAMVKGQTGRKHSEESKLKRSLALKGRKIENVRKGWKHSEETKIKLSSIRKHYWETLQC